MLFALPFPFSSITFLFPSLCHAFRFFSFLFFVSFPFFIHLLFLSSLLSFHPSKWMGHFVSIGDWSHHKPISLGDPPASYVPTVPYALLSVCVCVCDSKILQKKRGFAIDYFVAPSLPISHFIGKRMAGVKRLLQLLPGTCQSTGQRRRWSQDRKDSQATSK